MSEQLFQGIYLFSDIDGTLSNTNNEIPKENIEAIARFVALGGTFGAASGRFLGDIDVLEQVEVNGYCLLNNGAAIYDYPNKKIISSQALPQDILDKYLDFARADPELGLVLVNEEGYFNCVLGESPRPTLHEKYPPVTREEFQFPLYKVLFAAKKGRDMNEIRQNLISLGIVGVDYVQSGHNIMEVVPQHVSKGSALEELYKRVQIPRENTFFVGDSYNDMAIMKVAGYSASVGGSDEAVRACAQVEVAPFAEGAVASFIQKIEQYLALRKEK